MPREQVSNALLAADVGRANLLTNGGFEQWQRGTSFTGPSGAYTADRWFMQIGGTGNLTVSRQVSGGSLGAGASWALQAVYTHNAAGTYIIQPLKTSEFPELKGRTLTLSIRAYSGTLNSVRASIGMDGTGAVAVYSTYHPGNSTWQTLTVTAAIPTDATTINILVGLEASCTAYLDNAMLVLGSVAADYVPLHPADDLARCMRYYETLTGSNTSILVGGGQCYTTSNGVFAWLFKQPKAVVPTMTTTGAATLAVYSASGGAVACSAVTGSGSLGVTGAFLNVGTPASLVAGNATFLIANSGQSAAWTAEANP